MNAYKFLAAGARGRFSDVAWPEPGTWLGREGKVEECHCGIHACLPEQLLEWIDDELWEVELVEPVARGESSVLSPRARLVERVAAWNDETARALTTSCAVTARERVAAALERRGHERSADHLRHAQSVLDVTTVEDPDAAELIGYAVDCMLLARGARPEETTVDGIAPPAGAVAANVAFVSAHVCGRAAADECGYLDAFIAERARQLAWLRERLAL